MNELLLVTTSKGLDTVTSKERHSNDVCILGCDTGHTHAEEVASEICPQWHGKSVPSITTLKIFIFANTHCPYFNALGMAGNTVLFVVLVDIW